MINQTFWKSLITLCTVVVGVFYIEDRLEKTIEKNMHPINERALNNEKRIEEIERKSSKLSFEYRVATSETNKLIDFINKRFKTSFIKPSEIAINEE